MDDARHLSALAQCLAFRKAYAAHLTPRSFEPAHEIQWHGAAPGHILRHAGYKIQMTTVQDICLAPIAAAYSLCWCSGRSTCIPVLGCSGSASLEPVIMPLAMMCCREPAGLGRDAPHP